ncbi:HNH endonuclease [Gimesia maris]|uniref:HNH endonuclease n=1 Tax=Gimesia maris TaxID=122 RepID=UPI00118D2F4B|nr:HNH endonuclease [Gimesia maris]QDU15831.1 HNH endonuclease [Gimesia maris]
MPKTEYDIDGKLFHVEKVDTGWRGWFVESDQEIYEGQLKKEVLIIAGYKPPRPSGICITIGSSQLQYEYSPPRTMQDAYQDFLNRLSTGKKPSFKKDKPLFKFVIFARDNCLCFYCNRFIDDSTEVQLDHLIPRSQGGTDASSNIVTSCKICNMKKSNSLLDDLEDRIEVLRSRNRSYGIDDDHLVEF